MYCLKNLGCELNSDTWILPLEVRYHLDEDPKTLKVFPIPLHDSTGATLHYDRLSISPDGRILAATHASTLQWLSVETGNVLDTAEKAHDSKPKHQTLLFAHGVPVYDLQHFYFS